MESEAAAQSFDLDVFLVWAHTNRKVLGMATGGVCLIAAIIGLWVWKNKHYEASAGGALSELKPPAMLVAGDAKGITPEEYAKVADTYPGSNAGRRALLEAGTAYFEAGKFDQAQAQFERFLRECGDSPLRPEGMIGVAASLDAAGKVDQAAAKYKELIERHGGDSTMSQAKSALARLYVAQGKPDLALKLYEELVKVRNNDSWSAEAEILATELLEKHPELKPAPPAPVAPAPTMVTPTAPATPTPKVPVPAPPSTSAPVPLQLNAPKPAPASTSSPATVPPKKP